MTPTESPNSPDLEQAHNELREGLETSREIVRQSRLLIELSACDGAFAANDNDHSVAN